MPEPRITRLTVRGFKSIAEPTSVAIGPLTILAGANSSGKSSMIQPLLLWKQTLEAPFDPGPLLLNGPHVRFTSVQQLLSRDADSANMPAALTIGIEGENGWFLSQEYRYEKHRGLWPERLTYHFGREEYSLTSTMTSHEIQSELGLAPRRADRQPPIESEWEIVRDRIVLDVARHTPRLDEAIRESGQQNKVFLGHLFVLSFLRGIIHVPAFRGNPERSYPVSVAGPSFPGTFESYTASLIYAWQRDDSDRLGVLTRDLYELGLTSRIEALPLDDTQIELRVARLPQRGREATDLVGIADVGFGVSQALPVLVALAAAGPEHLVCLEQPEVHLHPRAQLALAGVLARAVGRGVQMIVETHSSLLLLGLQSLVAQGTLAPDRVKLHWFSRSRSGVTRVSTAGFDESGAFGDWPEDFGQVALEAEGSYLDAVESRLRRR